jgi:hypothetical protein
MAVKAGIRKDRTHVSIELDPVLGLQCRERNRQEKSEEFDDWFHEKMAWISSSGRKVSALKLLPARSL